MSEEEKKPTELGYVKFVTKVGRPKGSLDTKPRKAKNYLGADGTIKDIDAAKSRMRSFRRKLRRRAQIAKEIAEDENFQANTHKENNNQDR